MKISCVCPTYKRPVCLANVVKCFEDQTYEDKELIILDDARQYRSTIPSIVIKGDQWLLYSQRKRIRTLPAKYNELIRRTNGDIIVIWEDDDVYLPNHLQLIADAAQHGEFFVPRVIFSTYAQEHGEVMKEDGRHRFHGAWAFTRKLFSKIGGYSESYRLTFDQEMHRLLLDDNSQVYYNEEPEKPSYVYRWGSGGWNGSQQGNEGYQDLWDALEEQDFDIVNDFLPVYDDETIKIIDFIDRTSFDGYNI